jgi:N-acetylmuramoyl-L-alanine amidase
LNKTISDNSGGTTVDKHKVAVLYASEADKNIAEIFAWHFEDCVVEEVNEYKSYSVDNLYIVGGPAKEKFIARNLPDKYTSFVGSDRFRTLDEAMAFAKEKGQYN